MNGAIKGVTRWKATGGDGLHLELYEQYGNLLYPELLNVYFEAKRVGTLSPSMREAIIVKI